MELMDKVSYNLILFETEADDIKDDGYMARYQRYKTGC